MGRNGPHLLFWNVLLGLCKRVLYRLLVVWISIIMRYLELVVTQSDGWPFFPLVSASLMPFHTQLISLLILFFSLSVNTLFLLVLIEGLGFLCATDSVDFTVIDVCLIVVTAPCAWFDGGGDDV